MKRIQTIIKVIEPADSVERYISLGVDVRLGYAKIVDPCTVEIDGAERLTGRAIVIAAGGEPDIPDIPGLSESGYLTSATMCDELAHRADMPARLVIPRGRPTAAARAHALRKAGQTSVRAKE